MSTVAQSPSQRSEIAELFIRDAATLMLPDVYALRGLVTLCTLLLRPPRFAETAI